MTEKMMISSAMVNNLGCTWLRLVQTLQEMFKWFNGPTIENAQNFPGATLSILHITSQFINVFERLRNVFFKCNRFPYKETVTNEWFTLPHDENDRKQPVMVINVDQVGKENNCYLSQNGVADFMDSLNDDFHEVLFHGTSQEYAKNIIEDGIDLNKGAKGRDFSHGDGFYLGDNFKKAYKWPVSCGHSYTAVLVFHVEKTELRDPDKGLDLRNDKKSCYKWEEVVPKFRSGKPDLNFVKKLRKYDFIEGPMASVSKKKPNLKNLKRQDKSDRTNLKRQDDTYQLCVKKHRCAEIFDRSLHSVIFFEH